MGSKVFTTTNYTNTPITLTDLTNPVTLTGASNTQVGGTGNVKGNLTTSQVLGAGASTNYNTLDGGAIESAFGFANSAIKELFALTGKYNENVAASNQQNLGFVTAAQNLVDKKENAVANSEILSAKTIWIIAGLAVAFFVFKGSK